MAGFDVILLAGQSNADGSGVGEMKDPYVLDERIMFLRAEKDVVETSNGIRVDYKDEPFKMEVAHELTWGGGIRGNFALNFAKKYIQNGYLIEGRKVLIVCAAVGGTGFQKRHWGIGDPVYAKMLEMTDYVMKECSENRLVALLWHQGEHDAFEGNEPKHYREQLYALFSSVRARYGSNFPIIAGDFCRDWKSKNLGICIPIVEEIQSVLKEIGNSAFVMTDGLRSNDQAVGNKDDIHFCREDLAVLGSRYFAAFEKIVVGEKMTDEFTSMT